MAMSCEMCFRLAACASVKLSKVMFSVSDVVFCLCGSLFIVQTGENPFRRHAGMPSKHRPLGISASGVRLRP